MKATLYIFMGLVFLGFTACKESNQKTFETLEPQTKTTEGTSETPADFSISARAVGPFEISGKIPQNPEIYQLQKTEKTRYTEGGATTEILYVLSKNGEKHLILKPEFQAGSNSYNQTIAEIFVLSEKYKTNENIGVNSTLKEFSKTYPRFKIWYTYVSDRYVLENSNSSIQFLLDEKDFIGDIEPNSVKEPLQINDFSDTAKISKIRLYK